MYREDMAPLQTGKRQTGQTLIELDNKESNLKFSLKTDGMSAVTESFENEDVTQGTFSKDTKHITDPGSGSNVSARR